MKPRKKISKKTWKRARAQTRNRARMIRDRSLYSRSGRAIASDLRFTYALLRRQFGPYLAARMMTMAYSKIARQRWK